MKRETESITGWMLLGVYGIVLLLVSTCASRAQGQQGSNAVYNSSSTCCSPSPAFIDASVFAASPPPLNRNLCGVLNFVLDPSKGIIPSTGAVIDARGLNSDNTSMTCNTANPSPWAGITNPPPSTILLPAGTIIISTGWVLPAKTRIIGLGPHRAGSEQRRS